MSSEIETSLDLFGVKKVQKTIRDSSTPLGMTGRLDRHLLRICRPHLRRNDKCDADHDQKSREELTARDASNQGRVRFAKILDDDPKNRVAKKKHPGQTAVWLPRPRAQDPQNGEQEDSFEKGLIKLRRMARR